MALPKIGIIILTWHRKETIEDLDRCFRSLAKADYPLDRVVLICEENRSQTGETWPWIEKEWLPRAGIDFPKIINVRHPENAGFAAGNNHALPAARAEGCEYVYLLNQDTDVDPGFLREAVRRAEEDPKIALVQSLMMLGNDGERHLVNTSGNIHHFLGYGYSGGYRKTGESELARLEAERLDGNPDLEVGYASGGGLLCRMAFVDQVGLFDDAFFMYHEDTDATFNARIRKWKTVLAPKSVIFHHYVFSRSVAKFYWMERNRFAVSLTYYKLPTLLLLAPVFLGVEIASLFFAVRSGWWREKLRSWAFFAKPSAWKWIAERRRRAQRERLVSDREFLRHAESRILFQEGDASGGAVTRIANPLLAAYWNIARRLIRW